MVDFEATIIGAGVVGLSIARELSKDGKRVLVIEKNKTFGEENSTRNSGVIHSGIYYNEKTLKDKLCAKGSTSLYRYAQERKISFLKCGKLIVACDSYEKKYLIKIKENAERNNVKVDLLSKKKIKLLEPYLNVENALFSENSGIIDVHGLMINFITDIVNTGGIVNFNSKFSFSRNNKNYISLNINDDYSFTVKTKVLINCAGLRSQIIAKEIDGIEQKMIPKIRFVKGNYMGLIGNSPFARLVYPIPKKDGLGIHSTINFQGKTIFGPDTVSVDDINFSVSKNIEKKFKKSISQYWPDVVDRKLSLDYCGIRPKIETNDFMFMCKQIDQKVFIINLFGIESPGLTSCIEIGKYVKNLININN